jgi:hypothetical protein
VDHSDRLGRFTTLNVAASYAHDDLTALLQVYVRLLVVRAYDADGKCSRED